MTIGSTNASLNEIIVKIRVVARASKSEIIGEIDGALKVKVKSPPVDGAANTELVRLFAETLKLPKSSISIISGSSSRSKRIKIVSEKLDETIALLKRFS